MASLYYNFFFFRICLLQDVLRKNDAGDRFPLLAICLGFELITMIVSKVELSGNLHVKLILCSFSTWKHMLCTQAKGEKGME